MRRPRSLVFAAVVSALLLAACGSGNGTLLQVDTNAAPTAQYLADAAQRTIGYETGRAQITLTVTGAPDHPDPVVISATSSFDAKARRAAATVDLSNVAGLIAQSGAAKSESGATLLKALAGSVDVVVDGTSVYVKPGALGLLLGATGGKPWFKIDAAEYGALTAPAPAELPSLDPTKLLDELRQAGATVEEVGPEQVRGTDTTHYRSTITAEGIDGPAVLDVWIDRDGIVRRVQGTATGDGVTGTVNAELYDLGAAVSITVPSPDSVTTLPR
jgi:hypothetical protein